MIRKGSREELVIELRCTACQKVFDAELFFGERTEAEVKAKIEGKSFEDIPKPYRCRNGCEATVVVHKRPSEIRDDLKPGGTLPKGEFLQG